MEDELSLIKAAADSSLIGRRKVEVAESGYFEQRIYRLHLGCGLRLIGGGSSLRVGHHVFRVRACGRLRPRSFTGEVRCCRICGWLVLQLRDAALEFFDP